MNKSPNQMPKVTFFLEFQVHKTVSRGGGETRKLIEWSKFSDQNVGGGEQVEANDGIQNVAPLQVKIEFSTW